MRSVSPQALRYDQTTIILHWFTALLVIIQWLGAQVIDWFPRGPLRIDARSVHIVGGLLLTVVLIFRLIWRATRGRRLRPADGGYFRIVAKATHWGLYALLIAMVLMGIVLACVRGDSLFNLFSIPSPTPGNRALADQVQDVHGTIGWVILAVAGLHAAAALAHQYLWRDGVLARMLPRR